MHPGSTLFLDVCVQPDFWPGGAWPLLSEAEIERLGTLFAAAARHTVRQGGVVCLHTTASPAAAADAPVHCHTPGAGIGHPRACAPVLPPRLWIPDAPDEPALDRAHAHYVASGCGAPPDASPTTRRIFDHLTAGIRDAVVFGAGIEHGIDRAVEALIRRRIRTHVVLDAAASVDPDRAQRIIAGWKRRGVDGATVAIVLRLLTRAARGEV
jgi:hypothetical protein